MVRPAIWCNLPLAFGVLALGCLVLYAFELTAIPVGAALGLFFVGLMMIGMRLFFYVQQVEPQYWQPRRVPQGRCRQCDYDLTGNTSGVCPECGTAVPGRGF